MGGLSSAPTTGGARALLARRRRGRGAVARRVAVDLTPAGRRAGLPFESRPSCRPTALAKNRS